MCKCASFVVLKDRALWLPLSDSHEEIIAHFKLHEGAGRVNFIRVEISPKGGDLSLPLAEWKYALDQKETPDWYDAADCEARTRVALKEWAESKLSGWNVYEAFHPVNPFKLNPKPLSRKRALTLVKQWTLVGTPVVNSVGTSVRAKIGEKVWDSVWDSARFSVGDSVLASAWASDLVSDSVGASVWASVRAYTGGLFVPRITEWKYAEKLVANPWQPLTKLWYMGYVPSFDGKTWRLHCGEKAEVKYEFTREEIEGGTR